MNTPLVTKEQNAAMRAIGYPEPFPTIDQAVRWLREEKGAHMYATYDHEVYWQAHVTEIKERKTTHIIKNFTTHDAALSAGITESLKILTEQNK